MTQSPPTHMRPTKLLRQTVVVTVQYAVCNCVHTLALRVTHQSGAATGRRLGVTQWRHDDNVLKRRVGSTVGHQSTIPEQSTETEHGDGARTWIPHGHARVRMHVNSSHLTDSTYPRIPTRVEAATAHT